MKKLTITTSIIAVLLLLVTSCSTTKMMSCPDTSADKSVLARNKKAYKPERFRAPNKDFGRRKIKNLVAVTRTPITENKNYDSDSGKSSEDYIPIEEPVEFPAEFHSIAISSNESVEPVQLKEEIEKMQLTASTATSSIPVSGHHQEDLPVDEISDSQISAPMYSWKPVEKTKRESRILRKKNRRAKLLNSLNEFLQYKPALGMAVAGMVLSLAGLIVFGIPFGILAIVFSGIALARIKANPSQSGTGMAVAGLVIGIIDIVAVVLLLALA